MSLTQAKNNYWLLPTPADFIFLLVLYLALIVKPEMILFDGSTGWHLVSGNYILQHHNVPRADIFSYTFAGKPWIAYEWLSDLAMAMLVKLGGLNLLQVTVSCAIALLFFLLYKQCRENGCNFFIATLLTIFGALVSAIHWLARPHLFTFFGVYIFATQLNAFYQKKISNKQLITRLCLYMLIWANCHPGFLFGLGLISIYLASAIITFVVSKDKNTQYIKVLSITSAISFAITFFNPYGLQLYSYISNYLFKTNSILAATDEFLSPVFHGKLQPTLLEILFVLFIVGLAITKKRIILPDLLSYLVFAGLSLSAKRNMPLFVIIALPITARLYSTTIFNSAGGSFFEKLSDSSRRLITKLESFSQTFTKNEILCGAHLLPISISLILIFAALNNGQLLGKKLLDINFPSKIIPSKNLSLIKELHLVPENGLAFDNWGGIIKYKLDYPVFIDDRADFYGENFYSDYVVLLETLPGWEKKFDKYHIQWVLLPRNYRLTQALLTNKNWYQAGEDPASLLMVRKTNNLDGIKKII